VRPHFRDTSRLTFAAGWAVGLLVWPTRINTSCVASRFAWLDAVAANARLAQIRRYSRTGYGKTAPRRRHLPSCLRMKMRS
jgi:hypothetical protein